MREAVYRALYSTLVVPGLLLAGHLAGAFSSKVRRAVAGRYRTLEVARTFAEARGPGETYLFHCSSMGEFEHIKPFIRRLRRLREESRTVVTFFSPSGYDNIAASQDVDLVLYAPFDTVRATARLFRILKPDAFFVARYDIWPNQVWSARGEGIPCFVLNGSIKSSSLRLHPLFRWFLVAAYDCIDMVLAITDADARRYRRLLPPDRVEVSGDTKFDQALFRSQESSRNPVLPVEVIHNRLTLVCGSTWPDDEAQLIPAIKELQTMYPQLLAVICPHQPDESRLQQLEEQLKPLRHCRFSTLQSYSAEQVILVDRVGVLANLYGSATVAYVGGSFRQNIHNVLEPAANGIPVIFGPVNRNSVEAQLLKECGGAVEVADADGILHALDHFLGDDQKRNTAGNAALELVHSRAGVAEKALETVFRYLEQRAGLTNSEQLIP